MRARRTLKEVPVLPLDRGPLPYHAHAADDDQGLRIFLARVYLKMAAGLVLSAAEGRR